jgi:hypothetical protein
MPEWSKVYPELRDDYEMMELEEYSRKGKMGLNQLFSSTEISPELIGQSWEKPYDLSSAARRYQRYFFGYPRHRYVCKKPEFSL